ncbi:ParB N-terminal domain-containing protein [bacterium]|nr:ParB N-terminal domain-containing protein [bacterium]
MLVFTTIPVKDLCLSFDSSQQIKDMIQSKLEYKTLYEKIFRHGVLDPILVNQYPDRLQVETGGQRLLIARELGIETLRAFVYPKKSATMHFPVQEHIKSIAQLQSYFLTLKVPCYLDIEAYIKSGHIQLDTDS